MFLEMGFMMDDYTVHYRGGMLHNLCCVVNSF